MLHGESVQAPPKYERATRGPAGFLRHRSIPRQRLIAGLSANLVFWRLAFARDLREQVDGAL
jgi:hypothetical protein